MTTDRTTITADGRRRRSVSAATSSAIWTVPSSITPTRWVGVRSRHRLCEWSITDAQAAEIALAVKNVGQRLATRGDREGYARVYAELYRRYRISSYKNLPAARYEEVREWLHTWYQELDTDHH